jgi:hypothetical protein
LPPKLFDGKEIFHLDLDGKLMAARISSDGPSFQSSTPEALRSIVG